MSYIKEPWRFARDLAIANGALRSSWPMVKPRLERASSEPIQRLGRRAVQKPCILGPAVTAGVNLHPSVVDLRALDNVQETSKRAPDAHHSQWAWAEIEHNDGRAMYQRKAPLIQIIPVACQQDESFSECVSSVIFIGVSPPK